MNSEIDGMSTMLLAQTGSKQAFGWRTVGRGRQGRPQSDRQCRYHKQASNPAVRPIIEGWWVGWFCSDTLYGNIPTALAKLHPSCSDLNGGRVYYN